jgi:hypothetical protein
MMMNTPTFRRIYDAELLRTGSTQRAFGRAMVAYGFLEAMAQPTQEPGYLFIRSTHFRHKATLRRAGLVPVKTPANLADLGRDLGVTDRASLARLLWTLNTVRRSPDAQKKSPDSALQVWDAFLTETIQILALRPAA